MEIIKKSEQTGQHFHIECESSAGDHTILIRLVEYAFQIALDTGKTDDSSLTIELPYSAVIYLRSRETTPSRSKIVLKTPGGEVSYEIPILQIKNYSLTDIFDKKLYFLIPFYLFCLEKDFPEIEQNEEKLAKLIETYTGIIAQLERLVEEGTLSEFSYLTIRDMANKVTANLARKYKSIKERIGDIMGGKVLDYEAKQIRDAARAEGWKSGMERGMERGMELGTERGIELGTERGMELGRKRGMEQMIIQMLQRGNTPEEITLFSGIPLDDIKRVQEKLP